MPGEIPGDQGDELPVSPPEIVLRKEIDMDAQIEQLKRITDESDNIVFFGGAGVSTESGIPDFRSEDGLYHQKYKYPPETMLSHGFYRTHTAEFFEFYRDKMLAPDVQPNKAHWKLAQWEKEGKLKAIITQNIDGLHQKAGSVNVMELHGSVLRNYCEKCGKRYDGYEIVLNAKGNASDGVPKCDCGGTIRPDVVLYEEGLAQETLERSVRFISQADVLIVGGTSLVVYPAAGLIDYFRGRHLILINKQATPRDASAELVIRAPIGEVLDQL